MSDSAGTQPKSASRDNAADKQTLAHVEKWLAAIREVNHERGDATAASTRLDRLLASATE